MAALTATRITERLPVGNFFEQIFRVTTTSGATNEWVSTGLSNVVSATAQSVGNAPVATSVQLNAQGTGASENSSMGDLGVRAAGAGDVLVRVVGRP